MFTQFFGLKYNPFLKEFDVNDTYESNDIKEFKSRFKYIQSSRGILLLMGEPGTGKSTALRNITAGLNPGLFKPCYFTLSTVTVMDFYRGLLMALGEIPANRKVTMFHQIQQSISSLYYDQKITPVIMLDEIQLVSNSILEDIRLLFNFKMDSENPFVLILAGQPQIRNKLSLSVNAPLKQRISIKHLMQGLKKEEMEDYLASRLKAAGVLENIFTPSAAEAIFSVSKGVPRLVNNLATASLMYACSKRQHQIDEETVYQGQKDFDI
ncbi:ExeA family protein [Desulfitibacter alkalitolerans]|uniref:ExeA family protein n=1 Tax=Desulfitibacter alkalitolerans TaxID=264641 RepID=UPI000484390C|nr:AAA family ATPase [Desulfitibacter alkalitolerans]